jgi:hypothetical protein
VSICRGPPPSIPVVTSHDRPGSKRAPIARSAHLSPSDPPAQNDTVRDQAVLCCALPVTTVGLFPIVEEAQLAPDELWAALRST